MGGSEKLAVHHGFPESGTASAIGTANSQGARPAATRLAAAAAAESELSLRRRNASVNMTSNAHLHCHLASLPSEFFNIQETSEDFFSVETFCTALSSKILQKFCLFCAFVCSHRS